MKRYKVRIPLIAAAVMLAVQVILILSCLGAGSNMQRQIAESDFDIHAKKIENHAETVFDMVETVMDAMSNRAVSAFTEASTDLMSQESLEIYADEVNDYIDSLDIPEGLVDTVIFLGKTYDKVGYIKKIGGRGMVSDSLPTMSHLHLAGIDRWEGLKTASWEYDKDGSITKDYEKSLRESGLRVNESVSKRIGFFLTLLEDHVVVSAPTALGGSRIFLLLDNDFIASMQEEESEQYSVFMDGIPLYSTNDYRNLGSKIAERDSEWSYTVGTQRYKNRSVTLEHNNFELIVSSPMRTEEFGEYLYRYLPLILGLSVVMTVILALLAAVILFHSIGKLGRTFENQFKDGSYRKIPDSVFPARMGLPMLYRIFLIFMISLLFPSVLSGIYYRKSLSRYVEMMNSGYLSDVADSLEKTVREREKHILLASANLPEAELISFLHSGSENTTYLKNAIDAAYRSSGLFTHYAVFDRSTVEVYNTSTSSSAGRLTLDEKCFHTNSLATGIYYVQMAVDNSTVNRSGSPAVIYPLYAEGEFEAAGYFVLYVNTNVFYQMRPGVGHEFLLADWNDNYVFSSVTDVRDLEKLIGESGDNQEDDTEYLMIPAGKDLFNGRITTYNDIRIYREQSATLNSRYFNVFLVAVVFIIGTSLVLSRGMSMKLRKIDENMQSIRDISEITPIDYRARDEIRGLVDSYNRMVERMSALIEENAGRINRENELIAINSKTQLQMLQQQINPHLLYNTLEFISYNAKREGGSSAAGDMALALADLFRYTTSVKEDIVPLREELKHIRNYIRIHQLRYGERFDVNYSIPEEVLKLRVLKFTLQPFVENIFKYGIANKLHGALIEISAQIADNRLILKVSDNGLGMRKNKLEELRRELEALQRGEEPENPRKESSGGVGMSNVTRRLYMYYGEKAHLELESEFMSGFRVIITLPAEKEQPSFS